VLRSAEKPSGKARLQEILAELAATPERVVGITTATLFRMIDGGTPEGAPIALLIDEADAIFNAKSPSEAQENLRAILNVGYQRGQTVPRTVGQGTKIHVKRFRTFAPVCLAGIGRLPETIEDRSIVITLRRVKKVETIEKWRMNAGAEAAEPVRARMGDWAQATVERLKAGVDQERMPDELGARA